MVCSSASMSFEDEEEVLLPKSFSPTGKHVICARGKQHWEHKGNQLYRQLISAATEKYGGAKSKVQKSLIVSEIVDAIGVGVSTGGFVKPTNAGRWIKCTTYFSREKVSQSLRDSLHGQYKSSTKAKKSRSKEIKRKQCGNFDDIIQSKKFVTKTMSTLTEHSQTPGCDPYIGDVFTRANAGLLESIKKDDKLLKQYKDTCSEAKKKK